MSKSKRSKATGSQQAKLTARVARDGFEHLSSLAADIGIRRDRYLNKHLWDALEALEDLPGNSEASARVAQLVADSRGKAVRQVSLRLDTALIERINALCAEKRIPRDLFLDAAFEDLALALNMALDTVSEPYKHVLDFEGTKLEAYLYTDAEAEEAVGAIKTRKGKAATA
jgi:hypothetical protein